MADDYSCLNGDEQQYVASGLGVKNLDGLGGGGCGSTRRGTAWSNTKPPSVENRVYEAMYAVPHMMNESVVDASVDNGRSVATDMDTSPRAVTTCPFDNYTKALCHE